MLLNRGVLAREDLVERAPLALDLVDIEPVGRELVPLAFERFLPLTKDLDLGRPLLDLALELLDERDERDGRGGRGSFDRVMLEVVARLEDRSVRLLHPDAELAAKAAEDVALPGVVLGVDLALDLLVVYDGDAERPLRLRVVEGRASLADLEEELLPRGEGVAQLAVDVLRLEVPKRLELEPLVDVDADLAELIFDEGERPFEGAVEELAELRGGPRCQKSFKAGTREGTHERVVVEVLGRGRPDLEADLVSGALNPAQAADDAEPLLELTVPACARLLDRGIQVDDLVLNANLVNDRLELESAIESVLAKA